MGIVDQFVDFAARWSELFHRMMRGPQLQTFNSCYFESDSALLLRYPRQSNLGQVFGGISSFTLSSRAITTLLNQNFDQFASRKVDDSFDRVENGFGSNGNSQSNRESKQM